MPKFKIIVHCSNLDVPDEESGKNIIGFFATRYAIGKSIEEAFDKAKENIESENDFRHLLKITKQKSHQEPILEIDGFEEVPFYSGIFTKSAGYTLYPAE